MLSIMRKNPLSVPLLAMSALVYVGAAHASTAGDISLTQVLNTSPLWADTASYHACLVANISTASLNISIELIGSDGTVLATSGTNKITIPAGSSAEISNGAAYTGFARCRFTLFDTPTAIRANLTIFHSNSNGTYQTYATSEAR
jgi:hypothetical protein